MSINFYTIFFFHGILKMKTLTGTVLPFGGIVVPPVDHTKKEKLKAQLQAVVDPTSQSQNYGRDKYLAALRFVLLHS